MFTVLQDGARNREKGYDFVEYWAVQFRTVQEKAIRGLVSYETVVLRRWRVEKNVWFIDRVDN